MSKNLNDYVVSVQQEVDDTSNSALAVIQNEIITTYSEVMRQVGQYLMGSVTENYPAVENQTAYPAAQDASVIHQIAYKPATATNLRILYQISLEDFKDNFINRPASIPTVWFLDADVINVAPRPNNQEGNGGIVRLVYTPNITEVSSTGVSLLPDRYTRVIITGAIARFKAWENNLVSSQYYQSLYQQALHDCVLDLSNRSKPLKPKLYGTR